MDSDQLKRVREAAVRRASKSLGELLDRDPEAGALLAAEGPLPDRAGYVHVIRAALERGGMGAVRLEKRRRLLEVAARDLTADAALVEVGRALADLADACLEATLLAVNAPAGMAVIAMGKLGGRELNYCSDIDVMFVSAGDPAGATGAAEAILTELGGVAPEGQAFRIDTNLRPEGRSGALVRSLDGYVEYYRRWAQPWEYQALIKARLAAGDRAAAEGLIDATRSFVFPTEVSSERVASIRKMKERVESHAQRSIRRGRASDSDDVKLGPGGIRDIEFSVQLLQLVHGGTDPNVRSPSTLSALSSLVEGGYLAEDDGAGLATAYEWLRTVEHRVQLWQERQVHHLPAAEEDRARLARVLGFRDSPTAGAAARFERAHQAVLVDVRGRFERLFYRPMIEALAEPAGRLLSEDALRDRLRILGFRDADRAARTLGGLVRGTSRRAKLFRVLLPALLRHLSRSPLPDEGLFSLLKLGDALEGRPDLLGALRDNPPALEILARVLGSGRLLGDVLRHVPEEIATTAEPEGPALAKDRDRLIREAVASLGWRDPEHRLDGLRRFKRREMFRVALADLAGRADIDRVGGGLADLADACLAAALTECEIPFAVIGMGKLGGRELNYSSDIDVMFVHDAEPAEAEQTAEELMRAIGEVTPEGQAFRIDAGLRPEGKSGVLARSFDSFLEYYGRWASQWEFHALIKARHSAGDEELARKLLDETRALAFPRELRPERIAEIRHLKVRMERERIPRGTDARRHMKLGPGGLSDIEFAVQMIQSRHGHDHPVLQATGTLAALEAVRAEGLLSDSDAAKLDEAYRRLMLLRNRLFFIVGRPADALPVKPETLEALGIAMGYVDQPRQEVEEDYLRITRRARRVAEPLIYG